MDNLLKQKQKIDKSGQQSLICDPCFYFNHFRRMALFSVFFCLPSFALDRLASVSAINLEIYGVPSDLPTDSKSERLTQLINFIQNDVYLNLPTEVAAELRTHPLRLTFSENSPAFEFFQPGHDDPNSLEIMIRPSIIMSEDVFPLIAHAYFHAVQYLIHPDPDDLTWKKETWLREGLAQYFEFIVLKRTNGAHVTAASLRSSTSLLGEYEAAAPVPELYGHDLLYFLYLTRECGGISLFWKLARSIPGLYGEKTVEAVLKKQVTETSENSNKPQCLSFSESARSFEIARFLNKKDFSGAENSSRYFLRTTAFQIPPASSFVSLSAERLSPSSFKSDVKLPSASLSGMKRTWIQTSYPFAVTDDTYSPLLQNGEWIQLVYRP